MEMVWGLSSGAVFAAGDALLLGWVVKRAAAQRNRARQWLTRGWAAHGLLNVAVVILALLLPDIDAAGVVIALLIQKAVLAALVLLHSKNGRG